MAEEVSQKTYRLICDRNMGIEGLLFEEVVVEDVNETRKAKRVWATQPYVELLERNVSTLRSTCSKNMTIFFPSSVF